MNTESITRLKELKEIFTKSPKQVQSLASRMYDKPFRKVPLAEVLASRDIEAYQIPIITDTMKAAINDHVSAINQLIIDLHGID